MSSSQSTLPTKTFLPLTPIRSDTTTLPKRETPSTTTEIPSPTAKDVIVPFNRGRADSSSSTASANAYLWLSVDRE